MEFVKGLNSKQKEAVLQTEGPLLILAGAGSGKTKVLTQRIAYLIKEKGIYPGSIMAITFTNKAAKEMRERIDGLIGQGAEKIWVSTFHSSCVRILRNHIQKLGYASSFTIYDTSDQETLMKDCLKELNFNEKNFPPRSVLSEIGRAKDDMTSPEQYLKTYQKDFRQEKIGKLYALYQKKLKENNAVDFDDLICKTIELFETHPEVLEEYHMRYKYFLVDEYQDTNTAQYRFVQLLASKSQNLCVVGDDDQSIYTWRGANIRNILDFEKDFKNAVVIKLEQNYRCTKNILDAANYVIQNNQGRKDKVLWTENPVGEKIKLFEAQHEHQEAEFIADQIIKAVMEGREYKHFAVLYRTNAQSRVIEDIFMKRAIPYQMVGGLRFYDRKEIKDLVGYLRVVVNPTDSISLKRIINVPKRGIGDTTISRTQEYALENNISLYEGFLQVEQIGGMTRVAAKITEFLNLIGELRTLREVQSVSEYIETVLSRSGYISALEKENTVEARSRIENLREFISVAIEYENNEESPTLEGFLERVSLVSDVDQFEGDDNRVVMMTIHSAKGLEFPTVFLCGMEQGIFPSYRSLTDGDSEKIEEERRLCYVGITRAEETLYLSYARARMLYGRTEYHAPSMFIQELLPVLQKSEAVAQQREHISNNTPPQKPTNAIGRGQTTPFDNMVQRTKVSAIPQNPNISLDFVVGDQVSHKKFGVGEVKHLQPAGKDVEVTVDFPRWGEKKLMANFSGLQRI